MTVSKYQFKSNQSLLGRLFLEGDVIYISSCYHVMNGVFDYARDCYDSNKINIGRIRDDRFHEIEYSLEYVRNQ